MPSSLALLLLEFPPRQRPMAVAVWSTTGAIAAAAGPPNRRALCVQPAALDAHRWRGIGTALGIAVLVALLGTPGRGADLLAVFSRAWYLMLAAGLAASAMSLTVGRVRAQLPVAVAADAPLPAVEVKA